MKHYVVYLNAAVKESKRALRLRDEINGLLRKRGVDENCRVEEVISEEAQAGK